MINWRVVAVYFGLVTLGGIMWWVIGLTQAQARLMDVITSLVFFILFIATSSVARHNLRQLFKRNGHQWVGNGPHCEACNP